ncbi:methyltransferase domain-containing protein [Streptomyces sp. SudanB25_2051]|uniref:methyltransferase domain-containing protein n=1 Tax=Streptomyces sp. SudanB25_2051 TaxID=3035275 RepID=UPI003F553C05
MPQLSPRLAEAVAALPLAPHLRVLEIGCGPGAAARAVAARLDTGHILAIDRSAAAVARARAACADEIASGRLTVRLCAAEELHRSPEKGRSTSSSPSGSARSTDAIRRRGAW